MVIVSLLLLSLESFLSFSAIEGEPVGRGASVSTDWIGLDREAIAPGTGRREVDEISASEAS